MVFSRPDDGILKVWRTLDLVNTRGKKKRFSIQEIPKERYDEAIEHLCTIFMRDGSLCASLNAIGDPQTVEYSRIIFGNFIAKGVSVAAYELFDDKNKRPILAGLNMLQVVDDNNENTSHENMTPITKKIVDFLESFSNVGDPLKLFNTDIYLTSIGLSVDPLYRGFGLGLQLLEVRTDIGRAYNIPFTSTVFTSEISQSIALRAGFKEIFERAYEDAVDENGDQIFPSLKGKSAKLMIKYLL